MAEPTERGKLTEENTTETPMYVGADADVTAFPPSVPIAQPDLYKAGKTGTERAK